MARKLRLEFPGATYHVINRGNYRAAVFASVGAQAAFEQCLFEACAKSGWVLHAFVIMRNHFHLALETPAGNLVAGMQWLQATFANRCNRFRREQGPLFQGRYKAVLVEPGEALGLVCHYIHLNPVRAGLLPVEQLGDYRPSSYWYLGQATRPEGLRVATALTAAGGLADTPAGRIAYAKYLAWQATDGPAGKNAAYVAMSRGWALGSEDFKTALVNDHALAELTRAWETGGVQEIRERPWAGALTRALQVIGRTEGEVGLGRKSEPWKVAVAAYLKTTTQAGNRCLADRLHMGTSVAVSHHTGRLQRGLLPEAARLLAEIEKTLKVKT